MAQIVPKLNLNKTPALVENNSLVFAKNIRVDVDGSIHKDYSITNIFKDKTLLEKLREDFNKEGDVYKHYYDIIKDNTLKDDEGNIKKDNVKCEIIDTISDSTSFYILLYIIKDKNKQSIIVKYNEEDETLYPCNCNWNYSDGAITGLVVKNMINETLLVIAESSETDKIPLKCINLDKSKYTDDETIYTQTPNIPFINLNYITDYSCSIPNGVYQFFIRYKIRHNFYTNWFPASKELFAGNNTKEDTIYGTVSYHKDVINSNKSFVFIIDILHEKYTINFESFQIGFIVSNKQTSKARAWKHFSFDTSFIYFDYKSEDAEEINIEDFINPVFGIYNVKNLSFFKNKLYISNYEEFNFNKDENVKINVDTKYINNYVNTTYNNHLVEFDDDKSVVKINIMGYKSVNDILTTNFKKVLEDCINDIKNKKLDDSKHNIANYTDYNKYVTALGIKIQVVAERGDGSMPDDFEITDIRYDINDITKTNITDIDTFIKNLFDYFNIGCITLNCHVYTKGFNTNTWNIQNNNDDAKNLSNFYIYLLDEKYKYDTFDGTSYHHYYKLSFSFNIQDLFNTHKIKLTNISTLIPYQKYNIYVHYVKQTGETTNGYLVKTIDVPYDDTIKNCDKPISLAFSDINIPEKYVCCFFSIVLVKNKVSTVVVNNSNEGFCVELNNNLYGFSDKLNLNNNNDIKGVYYDSNDTSICRYFGAQGLIYLRHNNNNYKFDKNLFLINEYENNDIENYKLIKCTPYINTNTYADSINLNLLGFVCNIYPLDTTKTTSLYNDGSNIYSKSNKNESIDNLNIIQYNAHRETDSSYNTNWYGSLNICSTTSKYIYSNFNLNYLELYDELKISYITYYNKSEYDTDGKLAKQKIFKLQPSLLLSTMYKLDSTYYSYTRKTYIVYNNHDAYEFNNTIRCSVLSTDEENINVFIFEANDYYNIPTNKGIITSINGLGDILLIHTKDSMFKFTGHNTLQSNNGEVQQTESDIFNTGIGEIFSSDFGYAGLYDKKDSITTMIGYIFYDKNANIVYAYSGNGQIVKLSDSIEKIFRYDYIKNVSFANDYYNNRFFMCIHYSNDKTLTLSYCFNEEVKSFVSIHDFAFETAFNTRTKCYFITKNKQQISSINKSSFGLYPKFNTTNSIYPSYTLRSNSGNVKYASIIDIIENSNYENIKTLNFISWNNAIVEKEFPTYENVNEPFNALESKNKRYPCNAIMLYTDTCSTGNISCINISNNENIDKIQYYKQPRYNQGFWTLNYFRNILNSNNNTGRYSGDNNSLIEGKYFVARFILDEDFKFETINFNYNGKL